MDSVKEYKKRREERTKARMDAEEGGRWVTTEHDNKIHFNEGGEPDKGNPYVLAAMKRGRGKTEKEAPNKLTKSGKRSMKYTAGDISMADLRQEVKKLIDEKGIDNIKNSDVVAMRDKFGIDVSDWQNAMGYWRYGAGKKKLEKEKASRENKEYGYGSTEGHKAMKKEEASNSSGSYERLPFYMGSKENMSAENRKKVKDTVTRFMKEAKEGDVYACGGGFGSTGGQRFKVTTRRGKPALQWIEDRYSRPVQMNRANVESFIRNGAKLVK